MKLLKITLLAALGFTATAQAADIGEILNKFGYQGVYESRNEDGKARITIGKANQYAEIPFSYRFDYNEDYLRDSPCVITGHAKAEGNHRAFFISEKPAYLATFHQFEDESSFASKKQSAEGTGVNYCSVTFKFQSNRLTYQAQCDQCTRHRDVEEEARKIQN